MIRNVLSIVMLLISVNVLGQTVYPGYTLAWSDEFNGTSIDTTNNWWLQTGAGANGELGYYNGLSNASVSGGNLIIEARQESVGGKNYTTSRMSTQGKFSFMYGRVDIYAKLPVDQGVWPALWMLGNNYATAGQYAETDIMELVGSATTTATAAQRSQVWGSIHWNLADSSIGTVTNQYNLSTGDFSQAFHLFSLIWDQDCMQFLVDNIPYQTLTPANLSSGTWPFNAPQFLILNLAIGGNWPGAPDATTTFPQSMYVDYVRVYQKNPAGIGDIKTPANGIETRIYTIGGQYIGNDTTALPKGLYIINGKKVIK